MKYSKLTGGFYTTEIHGSGIPLDAVTITDTLHNELMVGQCNGKRVVGADDGIPYLVDVPVVSSRGGLVPYRVRYVMTADVINNSAVANTLMSINDLSFPVTADQLYHFEATIFYTSATTTTGSRWSITGPAAPTAVCYTSEYSLTTTSSTRNARVSGYDLPASSNASSVAAQNMAYIKGFIKPSLNGTVAVRFASEVANSAITAKTGSTLEVWQ